ncbi:copper resistance D family protein [Anaeromyxobacter oryzae]|uniref:Copper resistance protein n=1 Tax=Anaeromyxobacter oryzae TaxID=2918170 RepID=A0ABM7WUG5_9BACT|nr:CopD family protein [Anaeromyxobacter oryzae]BDG03133.1 copper resistance protein [Anaeromyxobacter oryzae]
MILLAGFLEVVFKALVLVGFVLATGGVAFGVGVLRPLRSRVPASMLARTLALVALGGGAVLIFQLATLLIEPWALADELGRWPVAEFLATRFARAGLAHAAVGGVLAMGALWARARAGRGASWALLASGAGLLAATGAPLVHGASRLEGAAALATITVVHQVAAGIWAGGLVHLLAQRPLCRDGLGAPETWAAMVSRFSRLAVSGVLVIGATGALLGWRYIATTSGLVGTAYGAMVLTKVALMGAALVLGAGNFLAAMRWRSRGATAGEAEMVRSRVEAETGIVLVIVLAAAALTSQPPAVDVREKATPREVAEMFAPKPVRLAPPPYREMVATAAPTLDPYALPGPFDSAQSNFNHNIAGLLVIVVALGALLDRSGKVPAARHWPLAFLALAAFMLILAEPNGWPFGPEGLFETLLAPSALLHRVATALVVALAVFEWRVRVGGLAATRWRFAFPSLALVGGALLLTHSHSVLAAKRIYLIEVSHNAIGFLAVLIGIARWLELRSPDGAARRRYGLVWPACMALVGLVLVFYREL